MNKIFTIIIINFIALQAIAQNKPVIKYDQPYGVIDTADLTMKECDFEKDAHAEVLFDFTKVVFDWSFIRIDRHVRIKIFDKQGEKYAVIRIPTSKAGYVTDVVRFLKAQTINLSGKNIVYMPVEKKYIYNEKTNEYLETLCISMPNIEPGSVFEVSYTLFINNRGNYPQWFPQEPIPVRYTEMLQNNSSGYFPCIKIHVSLPFACDTSVKKPGTSSESRTWALANLHSYKKEEYTGFKEDGIQYIMFLGYAPSDAYKVRQRIISSFNEVADQGLLPDSIVEKLHAMNSEEDMIAYVFNMVKTTMKWNHKDDLSINDHLAKVWQDRTGNSTEVNLVLYNMLMKAGIICYPLVVSTHNYPRVDFSKLYKESFDRTVVYVPIDNTRNYILDATSKYNNYKQTPVDLLDLKGLMINGATGPLQVASMIDNEPAIQTVFIDAAIKNDAKMSGTATITGYSYNKILTRQQIDTSNSGEYEKHLTNDDNNLKISSLKFENMDIDTLPLVQHLDFDLDLGDAGDSYIYFKPNIFSSLQKNPFTDEVRFSDIYFGYRRFYNITGNYKIPVGYKIDAMPKNTMIIMPDSSITFRLFSGVQEDGSIQIRYLLHFNKSLFLQSEYAELREFYRKIYEALDEQVVLKKSQ